MPTYSTPNSSNEPFDGTEAAKHWDYLGSVHQLYMYMMYKYRDFMVAKKTGANISMCFHEWKVSISTLRFMILYNFDKYLESKFNENTTIKPLDYDTIITNSDEARVYVLMSTLIYWCQADGIFKLEMEKQNPMKWFISDNN